MRPLDDRCNPRRPSSGQRIRSPWLDPPDSSHEPSLTYTAQIGTSLDGGFVIILTASVRIVWLAVLLAVIGEGCGQHVQGPAGKSIVAPMVATSPTQVTWSGDVDDTASVFLQGGKAWTDNVTGKGVGNVTTTFDTPMPSDASTVKLAMSPVVDKSTSFSNRLGPTTILLPYESSILSPERAHTSSHSPGRQAASQCSLPLTAPTDYNCSTCVCSPILASRPVWRRIMFSISHIVGCLLDLIE